MRTLRQQIEEKCIHFNGVQNDKCKAGVTYKELAGCEFPCFRGEASRKFQRGKLQCGCSKREWPTEEYVQNEIDMWDREHRKIDEGLKAVAHIRKEHKGKNWSGTVECPICKGTLRVSHAASNGHVHAQCQTPDCIAWME